MAASQEELPSLLGYFPEEYRDHPLAKAVVNVLASAALTKHILYDDAVYFASYMGDAFRQGVLDDPAVTDPMPALIQESTTRK